VKIAFRVNGLDVEVDVPPMKPLLTVLRDELGLTGTKYGCGEGECGACTVRVNGATAMSCLLPVVQVSGAEIRTVEGLSEPGTLGALQRAFLAAGGAQCGICTPGMLMTAAEHVEAGGASDEASIREALSGNLCRCTGYVRIVEAVREALAAAGGPDSGERTGSGK
jgi:aerobic-type carbon monoxide dehydrogenase small subunit (CoxS/CutS family)